MEWPHCGAMWWGFNRHLWTIRPGGFDPSDTDRDTLNPTSLGLVCFNVRKMAHGPTNITSTCDFAPNLWPRSDFHSIALAHESHRIQSVGRMRVSRPVLMDAALTVVGRQKNLSIMHQRDAAGAPWQACRGSE